MLWRQNRLIVLFLQNFKTPAFQFGESSSFEKKRFTAYLEGASGEASLLVRVLPINDRDIWNIQQYLKVQ
jgi:hypothetical protein